MATIKVNNANNKLSGDYFLHIDKAPKGNKYYDDYDFPIPVELEYEGQVYQAEILAFVKFQVRLIPEMISYLAEGREPKAVRDMWMKRGLGLDQELAHYLIGFRETKDSRTETKDK